MALSTPLLSVELQETRAPLKKKKCKINEKEIILDFSLPQF